MFTRQISSLFFIFSFFLILSPSTFGEEKEKPTLLEKSLEELMNLEITTVGKKEQSWFRVPSAVAIITPEEIKRAGHTSYPELLRLVPGFSVAQIDSNKWAVSTRGFRDLHAHNLLVLQDGRSIYSPVYGGVFWNSQDTLLDNIERIEAVRGPGGSLWGSNASTGIVNVITKSAKDTQGWHFSGTRGSEERNSGEVRYGSQFSSDGFYRVNVKYFDRDETVRRDDSSNANDDDWEMLRGEARADWKLNEQDDLMIEAGSYAGDGKEPLDNVVNATLTASEDRVVDIDMNGSHLLARWDHALSDTDNWKLQAYYDWYRYDEDTLLGESRWTGDIDFQHQLQWTASQNVNWGVGYRYTKDDPINYAEDITMTHDSNGRGDQTYSAFIQDEIAVVPQQVLFTVGSKFEHNDYTGFEVQPSARLAWLIDPNQTLWASVGRAVRVPSRFIHDGTLLAFSIPGFTIAQVPSPKTRSEELLAYEIGYRFNFMDKAYVDATAFYNTFTDLLTPATGTGPFTSNIKNVNKTDSESYGVELSGSWQAKPYWKLTANYSLMQLFSHTHDSVASASAVERIVESFDPDHQFQLHSYWDVTDDFSVDTGLYYVDHTPALIEGNPFNTITDIQIPHYVRLDMRFAWKIAQDLTLSLVGQNLLDKRHPEYVRTEYQKSEIQRAAYAKLEYKM